MQDQKTLAARSLHQIQVREREYYTASTVRLFSFYSKDRSLSYLIPNMFKEALYSPLPKPLSSGEGLKEDEWWRNAPMLLITIAPSRREGDQGDREIQPLSTELVLG